MRRFLAIARATALEVACDPFAFLVTLAALVLSTFAGALHYHQFGEPSRMAREAGLSAILVGGLLLAVFSCIRTLRRELETQTAQMALAHSISRGAFFCAKLTGVAAAYFMFFLTVLANSVVAIRGAVVGYETAQGAVARVWGPSLALGVAAIVVPVVAGGALNRFFGFRYVRSAMIMMLAISLGGVFYRFDARTAASQLCVALALVPPAMFFMALSGAFAVRIAANGAAAFAFAAAVLALPAFGTHYLADAVAKGAPPPWAFVGFTYAAAAPLIAAAVVAGMHLFSNMDSQ